MRNIVCHVCMCDFFFFQIMASTSKDTETMEKGKKRPLPVRKRLPFLRAGEEHNILLPNLRKCCSITVIPK